MERSVSLVNFTPLPTETMMWAFMNMHHDVPSDLSQFIQEQENKFGNDWEDVKKDFLKMLSFNPHNTVMEFVNFVFIIKGCSRAFQQQLTRTRLASYSIQSLRIVNVETFADDENYHIPANIINDSKLMRQYEEAMSETQDWYRELLVNGAKVEDARGVLPLNICSPITMSINLNSLRNMLSKRLCLLTQDEFGHVARSMVDEVEFNIGPEYRDLFQAPCVQAGFCPMPVHCGKMPYEQRELYKSLHIERWLKG